MAKINGWRVLRVFSENVGRIAPTNQGNRTNAFEKQLLQVLI